MSGTELGYMVLPGRAMDMLKLTTDGAMPPVSSATSLRACYAMSGTDVAYAATRVLCAVRYWRNK
eukprot:3941987-Rhodomonas_salina.3